MHLQEKFFSYTPATIKHKRIVNLSSVVTHHLFMFMLETIISKILYAVRLFLHSKLCRKVVLFILNLVNNSSIIATVRNYRCVPYVFTHTSFIITTEVFQYLNNWKSHTECIQAEYFSWPTVYPHLVMCRFFFLINYIC